jgi:hypothetical protein
VDEQSFVHLVRSAVTTAEPAFAGAREGKE